jgi:hypothetical protein
MFQKNRTSRKALPPLLAIPAMLAGCATFVDNATRGGTSNTRVTLQSSPAHVYVQASGGRMLATPAIAFFSTSEGQEFVFSKDGYEPSKVSLHKRLNPWLLGNLLTGGLGLIVDFSTGSAWKLSPRAVRVVLAPQAKPLALDPLAPPDGAQAALMSLEPPESPSPPAP